MSCLLLRDADCGAMAVIPTSEGVVTMDHGYSDYDYSCVLNVLESVGRVASQGNGVLSWECVVPAAKVLDRVESAMRTKGYSSKKHDAQVVMRVEEDEARKPRTPFSKRSERFHESLERGLRKEVESVHAVAASLGDFRELSTRFYAQHRTGNIGESLPFVRISGVLRNPIDSCDAVKEALTGIFPDEGLVKLTVENIDEGYLIDIGYAPTVEMCQEHAIQCITQFDPNSVRGSRSVRFRLSVPLTEHEAQAFEEHVVKVGAANSVAFPNGYTIVARAGSDYVGESIRDSEFGERVNWMCEQLETWGAKIDLIGEYESITEPVAQQ